MPDQRPMRLTAASASHVGLVRRVNEDAACLVRMDGSGAILAAVADGMGGHGGGDLASRLAVDALKHAALEPLPARPPERYRWLLQAITDADVSIRATAARSFGMSIMGATLAAVVATPEGCLHLHGGDCRFYHFHDGLLQYHTTDHSVVQVLVDTGSITEDEATTHPMRSVVTSSLGGGRDAQLRVDPGLEDGGGPAFRSLAPGDTLLLCSDGLWGEVPPDELQALVAAHPGRPRRLARACVDAALAHGARDNVTVVVICAGAA